MYSTNTNNQQDRGRQALNVKPAPWGGHYIIHIEDVITDTGKHGLSIYNETLREADHETPASLSTRCSRQSLPATRTLSAK